MHTQFVKHLQKLAEKSKQRAEVAVYFKRFDEAETLYHKMDRPDLAIDMRMRWGAAVQPQRHGSSAVLLSFCTARSLPRGNKACCMSA